MNQLIKPLSVHPPPESGESIGHWIERLAIANKTSFKLMLFHIVEFAKEVGFLEVLNTVPPFQIIK